MVKTKALLPLVFISTMIVQEPEVVPTRRLQMFHQCRVAPLKLWPVNAEQLSSPSFTGICRKQSKIACRHFCCSLAWRWGCYGSGEGELVVMMRDRSGTNFGSSLDRPGLLFGWRRCRLSELLPVQILNPTPHRLFYNKVWVIRACVKGTLHEAGVNGVCSHVSSFKSVRACLSTCSFTLNDS